MKKTACLLVLLCASTADAKFTVAGAVVGQGPGFVAFEKGGVTKVKFESYSALVRRVQNAEKYARANGGDLPSNAFWNNLVAVYREADDLEACRRLLALLRKDARHDARHPVVPPPVVPPPATPHGMPSYVPEPASWLMIAVGMIGVAAWRRHS